MVETKASSQPGGASPGNARTGNTPMPPRPSRIAGNGQAAGGSSPPVVRTDAATFEVVKNSLYAVAEEMKVVLAKTAYSPILKVAGDYSCGVFDASGNMVAQGPDLPIHLGSMPDAVRAVTKAWGDDIGPGDTFIHNDPYFGGSHLPDVNVVTPAFVGDGDTLLGFCCVRAHWPDVGSATPGSYGAVTDVYGEGLRLPPVRIQRAGVVNRDVEDIIFTNVRTPAERRGDLRAQIAANRRACDRLAALARKHGEENLARIMQEVMDYSEAMMRGLLRELPDGEGSFEDFCDGDGILTPGANQDETFDIRLRVIKRGDRLTVDFTGSDPQVAGPMNAPLSVTASGVFAALKTAVDSAGVVPPNSGAWRPVEVLAPEGTVVNAAYPAPVVYANHEISHRVCDMVFGALASFMPDQVMACSQGTSAILTLGGVDYRNEERYVSYETVKGGFGARPDRDGINANRERDLQHHEHAGGDPRDELSGARRVVRAAARLGRRGPLPRRARRSANLANSRTRLAGDGVLRTDEVGPVRPRGRRSRCTRPHLRRRAGRRRAAPEQQGLVRRAGGSARRLRRAGLGWIRPTRRTGPGAASRGPRRGLRHRGGGGARLRRSGPRRPVAGRKRRGAEDTELTPLHGATDTPQPGGRLPPGRRG